nr:histidine kinase cki1 [Quercus suber]
MLAVFSNTSSPLNWYAQPVDRDNGKLYGQAIAADLMATTNSSWIQQALNSTSGYSWLGKAWSKSQDSIFLSAVAVDGRGVVSFGLPAKVVIDHFSALDFHGGNFHLATKDGKVIIQTSLPNARIMVSNNTVLVQMVNSNGDPTDQVANFSCESDGGSKHFDGKVSGMKYTFYCSTLEIAGVETVYVLAYPTNRLVSLVHQNSKLSFTLLLLLFVFMVISLSIFLFLIVRAAKREMFLCAALIKQMESTQQAERKSMNKSHAFARASHDVRASLAAITGLIELSNQDANHDSVLATNLAQMNDCTKDLLGLLNSVLDTSKIEAGKMQLQEGEFNLAQLLEDVVDMFYPMAIKKGIDIVLDPCDGSIAKSCHVRGDRGKLKQILCNLLSNAVKYTTEGHITVRAMVQETSFENAIIASNSHLVLEYLSRLCYKNKKGLNDLVAFHTAQQEPNLTEFVIEVDDTGLGIPKDKQKSVFEYYNQVTETASGQEGSGLGLGIVQSLVRLMGGDIRIVDKEPGERGTCFNLNIKLPTYKPESADTEGEFPRVHSDRHSNGFQSFASLRSPTPKPEGSHVVLLIQGDQRRKILMNYIESLNIKVSYVKQGKNLLSHLEKIKHKLDLSYFSFSEKTQMGLLDYMGKSASFSSDSGPIDGPSCIKDGSDHVPLPYRKINSKSSPGIILIVIDASAGTFSELCSAVFNFRKDIQNSRCKVVWLYHPTVHGTHSREPPCDHIVYEPFHGSRLYQVLGLIPELRKCNLPRLIDHNSSYELDCEDMQLGMPYSHHRSLKQIVIHKPDEKSSDMPLNGKKTLVVEDNAVLRKVTIKKLCSLGAEVEVCVNGKEAFDHICKVLTDHRKGGHSNSLPYDYIFMDCEMPVMNGLEATKLIRMEEQHYGIHLPIVALTAHGESEQISKMLDAGMDIHLIKPLKEDKLLEAIRSINNKQ